MAKVEQPAATLLLTDWVAGDAAAPGTAAPSSSLQAKKTDNHTNKMDQTQIGNKGPPQKKQSLKLDSKSSKALPHSGDDLDNETEMLLAKLEIVKNRQRKKMPMFQDLSVEGERLQRTRRGLGGPAYWKMPFRHQLYMDMKE